MGEPVPSRQPTVQTLGGRVPGLACKKVFPLLTLFFFNMKQEPTEHTRSIKRSMRRNPPPSGGGGSQAWKFLKEQKLIRAIVPPSPGKISGILLLLSDDKREKHAREYLGLSFPDAEELKEYCF